jgi:hypothetical protein
MIRLFVTALLLLSSPLIFANTLESFFSKTEGQWELERGNILFYDAQGNALNLILSKLATKTVRISQTEWKFDEVYCSIEKASNQESCTEVSYIYEVINQGLLLLKSSDGEAKLFVSETSDMSLSFEIHEEGSDSVTDCTYLDSQHMRQSGKTHNSDGSSSLTSLTLRKL